MEGSFARPVVLILKKVYGELGRGFIEAHHTIAVSELYRGAKTKAKDIALLCPNCHRMVHRRRPWFDDGSVASHSKMT